MGKRSQIIMQLPKKMYTIDSYLAISQSETEEDAKEHVLKQKSLIADIKQQLRSKYKDYELTDDEINLLMDYQVNRCLKYNNSARIIDPHIDVIAILDEIDIDADYFHNVLSIGELLSFDTINEKIAFALKYSRCQIWNDLLECAKKNQIDESVIYKLKVLNKVNSKAKGDINLKTIIEWNGNVVSIEFENTVDAKEFSGNASSQNNFVISFYKYNEEVIRIKTDGSLYYSSVKGKGHPSVAYEMYESEIEITEDMKNGNGSEIYIKAAQELNNITIIGAGEHPMLYLPENLSDDQKKVLYRMILNCNIELFEFAVVFIDKNGELREPLYVNEYGDLAKQEDVDAFIDLYLGRYQVEELNGYIEIDLHLEGKGNKLSGREAELCFLEKEAGEISAEEGKLESGIIFPI